MAKEKKEKERPAHKHESKKESKHDSKKESKKESRKESKKESKREAAAVPADNKITSDDFYLKSEEFRLWLRSKEKSFESLSGEAARALFDEFVKRWNKGRLDAIYYSGLSTADSRDAIKSQHKWGLKLSVSEQDALAATTTRVLDQTRGASSTQSGLLPQAQAQAQAQPRPAVPARVLPPPPSAAVSLSLLQATAEEHGLDLGSSSSSNAALLAKRKERSDATHGAHREKEARADGLDMSAGLVLGGGKEDDAQLAAMRRRQQASAGQRQQRLAGLEEKEKERDEAWKRQIGLPELLAGSGSGQRIVIAPRPPPGQ